MAAFSSKHSFDGLSSIQLDGYLDRIGLKLSLPAPVTLETLNQVMFHHANTIPFELSKLLFTHQPGPVNVNDSYDELVIGRRGGYCFANNILIFAALKSLGFNVSAGAARVAQWSKTAQEFDLSPPQHMLMFVDIDQRRYLVDMGNHRYSQAIELKDGSTLHGAAADETFQIRMSSLLAPNNWIIWFKRAPWAPLPEGCDEGGFIPIYHFGTELWRPRDFDAMNIFVFNARNTVFPSFIASNVTKSFGRTAMTDMTFRRREGANNRHLESVINITNVDMLVEIMDREYGIRLTEEEKEGARMLYFS
ncbi:cysteine proteinase [Rhizoclosmatium globosum]|uniref:Cysteine proteinase n=1 Tax=Rhizoclosmatium globosum TaxID=329046 RepID=A0A1Y2CZ45_9FUNG|nr:cysteine proteinase [Rhizoclosmatium globosum]|eukprot:ORY51625.1 cysteine proteinase [Rhizoclosmatium globosum]